MKGSWYFFCRHYYYYYLPNMRRVLVTKFFTWFDIILRSWCSQQVETPYRKNFHVPFALDPVDRRLNDLLWPQTERAPQNVNDGGKLFFTLGRPRGWGKKCTHTHKHTHTYTEFIYTFLYTDPHGKMYNGFFSINIYIYKWCVCVIYVYRKHIHKKYNDNF